MRAKLEAVHACMQAQQARKEGEAVLWAKCRQIKEDIGWETLPSSIEEVVARACREYSVPQCAAIGDTLDAILRELG